MLALLRAWREKEIHTALDTCGFAPWEVLDTVREYVDLFLYDLKLMDDAKHCRFAGVSNKLILRNLQTLSQQGHDICLRVPIIPQVNDDEHIRQIGELTAALPLLNRVDILPYHHIAADKYRRSTKRMIYPTPVPLWTREWPRSRKSCTDSTCV